MTFSERHVIVKEFPRSCDSKNSCKFLHDLTHEMAQVVRPAVVLDCSSACKIDRQAIRLFLCCLEEAMKRNGDVRLAGLHRDGWSVLRSSGVERLFQHFASSEEAINSYRRPAFDRTAFAVESSTDEAAASAA